MILSERKLKWILRLYPPLLFQRIWVIKFNKNFRGVQVRIFKSFFNKNYNGSVFGGTIFSAADPFYPVLFNQILNTNHRKLKIWSKSSKIDFLKPAYSDLYFQIFITDTFIQQAADMLDNTGKFEHSFQIQIIDSNNDVCASLINEVYVRDYNFVTKQSQ
ncbi:DUF4442 domain-containing protein [Mucilaginibacter litoreus]|uniref:DUF4442 domain-containing protein n=1 Tax=Mucilaginibacter litoreus TaxID=1048221 RepID=A0ABW3AS13_9SPHI